MNLKTASKSRVFLSTDRCSLPESKMSVVIVKAGVSVRMMPSELSILSRWFSYLGRCSRKCLLVSSLLQKQRRELTMFLLNKWELRALHCVPNLVCIICKFLGPL